jgi:hypothetical protein
MAETTEPTKPRTRPNHYVCPCCHLYLLAWDPPTRTLEMFHKIGLSADFWSGRVRLICQHCLGATDVLPDELVDLLRVRYALGGASLTLRRAQA